MDSGALPAASEPGTASCRPEWRQGRTLRRASVKRSARVEAAPSSLSLRAPGAEDFAVIAGWVRDAPACQRWAGPGLRYPFDCHALPRLIEAGNDNSFVLAAGSGEALGFGQFFVQVPGAVHLARIIVAPAHRGRGLGRRLVTLLMAVAAEASGATRITLRVYRDNSEALGLYLRLGFRTVAVESDPAVWFMERVATAPA